MTGMEAVALAAAKKALVPHAAKLGKWIANKLSFRLRVTWGVYRRAGFKFPYKAYYRWLKTVTTVDLEKPFEVAGPMLALKLDSMLYEADSTWKTVDGHGSKSLDLVNATYLTMLKTLDASSAKILEEQWNRLRSASIVDRLVDLSSGTAPISVEDLAAWLRRRSDERRRVRLAAFGTSSSVDNSIVAVPSEQVPQIASGATVALVGDFGCGKSEIAEQWHRECIDSFGVGSSSLIPFWISARELSATTLEELLVLRIGKPRAFDVGVSLVIDGLDEVDGAVAQAIVLSVREYIAGTPSSKALLTSRPGILRREDTDVHVDGTSEEFARSLVQRVSGQNSATYGWDPSLIQTIRNPFFALAAGSILVSDEAPSGQAEIIKTLVEHALEAARATASANGESVFRIFTKLAVNLTDTNGTQDGLSFFQRGVAVSTTLVTKTPYGGVQFSLPIFEQWFSAQALINGDRRIDETLFTPSSFDRWRWAIAVATLGGDVEFSNNTVEACLTANPGIGAWIIDQVASKRSYWGRGDDSDLNQVEAQIMIARAARTWIQSIGSIAPNFFPVDRHLDPFRLGVRVNKRQMFLGWTSQSGPDDEVVELPEETTFFPPYKNGWIPAHLGVVPPGNLWAWSFFKDTVANNMLELLNTSATLGSSTGMWRTEYWYKVARLVYGESSLAHVPLKKADTLSIINDFLEMRTPEGIPFTGFHINGRQFTAQTLIDLRAWLTLQSFSEFVRPLPRPDRATATRWVRELYSPKRTVEYCAEVFGNACEIYEDLMETDFSRFDWTLSSWAAGPFCVLGVAIVPSGDQFYDEPVFHYHLVPFPLFETLRTPDMLVSTNGRAAVALAAKGSSESNHDRIEYLNHTYEQVRQWGTRERVNGPFWSLFEVSTAVDFTGNRPASEVAARWIANDLKRVSLFNGTSPQF
jgi:hypothetical protein